jgi:Flp pilus assembly protein TadD
VLPLSHVGTICAQTGRDEEAETLLRRAIELGGDETKSSDAALVNALCNLGKLCAQQERFEEAAALWTRGEGMEQRLHPGTPGHLNLLEDLAHVRAELGDEAGATECRERAAKLRSQGK